MRQPKRAVLGGDLRLDPAPDEPPDRAMTNRALHADAVPRQFVVVGGHAVVHVDERAGHVAVHQVTR